MYDPCNTHSFFISSKKLIHILFIAYYSCKQHPYVKFDCWEQFKLNNNWENNRTSAFTSNTVRDYAIMHLNSLQFHRGLLLYVDISHLRLTK